MSTRENRSRYDRIQTRIYEILEVSAPGDGLSKVVNLSIIALVLLNVASFGLGFLPHFAPYRRYLHGFELFSVGCFTLEYALRLWSCTVAFPGNPVTARLRFALRPQLLIDLFAVLPFYLPLLIQFDLRFLRLLRLLRLIRLVKLTRYLRQLPVEEHSLEDLLAQYQQQLAQIHGTLSAARDRDLAEVRARIDRGITALRQSSVGT